MGEDKRSTLGDFMNQTFAKNSIMAHISVFEEAYGLEFDNDLKDRIIKMYETEWYDYYLKFVQSLDLDVFKIQEKDDIEPKLYLKKEDVDAALIKTSILGFITQLIIIELSRIIEKYQKDQ